MLTTFCFDSAGRTGPKAVDGTFADLEFSRALFEVRVGEIIIPQGFIIKGSLKLPSLGWDVCSLTLRFPSRVYASLET